MILAELDDKRSAQKLSWMNGLGNVKRSRRSVDGLFGLGDDDPNLAKWKSGARQPAMQDLLGQIESALSKAQSIVDSPPFFTDSGVLSGWKTNTKLADERILPLLRRDFDEATTNDVLFKKWAATARSSLDALQFIERDVAGQGLLAAIKFALESIPKTLAPVFDLKNIALVAGGLAVLYVVARGIGAGRRAS